MGKKSRVKGDRNERQLVSDHKVLGLDAEKVPLSGAAGGSFTGDVLVRVPQVGELRCEAKVRSNGFRQLYAWLQGNNMLTVRADRQQTLVVLPWATWARILAALAPQAEEGLPDIGAFI